MVGIFIVNNNPETMTLRLLQPTVCISAGVSSVHFAFRAAASAQPESRIGVHHVALHIPLRSRKKMCRPQFASV
jgi:hypothetical protein